MTPNERSREAAFADLVSGLIDARVDVASVRFDAELEAAEAAGRLDPATARLLRWWQRESVRGVTEHARTTVPATLVALEAAEREAREAVHRAEAAWTTARSVTARAASAAGQNEPAPEPAPEVASRPEPAPPQVAQPRPEAPAPAAPTAPAAPVAPAAPAAPTTLEPPHYPGGPITPPAAPAPATAPAGSPPAPPAATPPAAPAPQYPATQYPAPQYPAPAPAPAPAAAPAYPTTPGEAPGIVDLTSREEPSDPNQAGRRRTLLAGLTVLPRND